MNSTRKDNENEEKLSVCKNRATFFNEIASQKCRTTMGNIFSQTLRPLHSEAACRQASLDAVNAWEKCIKLLPEAPKPELTPVVGRK